MSAILALWCGGMFAALLMSTIVTPQIQPAHRPAFALTVFVVVVLWAAACFLLS